MLTELKIENERLFQQNNDLERIIKENKGNSSEVEKKLGFLDKLII